MFQLSSTPLEQLNLRERLDSDRAGAFNCFEGRARNHNDGKKVLALEFEAYDSLCATEAERIIQEAYAQFDILAIKCVHRVGKVGIGEMAVWIGVSAAHRADSFNACRYVIDELKARLPIWKKEYYQQGDSGWIASSQCASCIQMKE